MVGVAPSARILPPLEPAAEPIYVNPKQYNAIVRRRQKKAKLEAENKAVKTRKVKPLNACYNQCSVGWYESGGFNWTCSLFFR